MKKAFMFVAFATVFLFGCVENHDGHDHEGHDHPTENNGLEPLSFTLYSEKTELFVEFPPLVVGQETRFTSHLTELGRTFKALADGTVKLTFDVNGKATTKTAELPLQSGIFRLELTPDTEGTGTLTFDIQTKRYVDQIVLKDVYVFADTKSAFMAQKDAPESTDITYLKEQAWKVEFANTPVSLQPFSEIIKTSGQILPAPGDETIVTSRANGIVLFAGSKTIIGSEVANGTTLFTIAGGDMAEGNMDAAYKTAKSEWEIAKTNYDRAGELVKDKIISQKEFQQAKLAFENAQTALNVLSKNYSASGMGVSAPASGFLKNILVTEGQYVEQGTPLATVSKNKKLLLQANVSQKYFSKLTSIVSANFKTVEVDSVFNTAAMNGKVVSFGRSAAGNSAFLPVVFEIDNIGNLIPGSVAEVYLQSEPLENVLTIPLTSLLEEQGAFFVYVQTGGESFQKRGVKLGADDGVLVQVVSGVEKGERVVSKGAYQIKLATASGAMPAHGHEH